MTEDRQQDRQNDHPDEHPERWLDLALGRQLTSAERTLLDQHLAICSVCATQLRIAESFRSMPAPGSHDDHLDRWAVERAMATLAYRPSSRWWHPSPRLGWAFAAVVLLLATGVSAKLWISKASRPTRVPPSVQNRQDQQVTVAEQEHRAQPTKIVATDPTPADIAPREAPRPRRPPPLTAAALFERARELGHEGNVDAALAIHFRLQRVYPSSAEAGLSSALAGRLLLDRNRPSEALIQFDRHLARGGAADEEALAGRAASLEQLGRHREEEVAWRMLLERHPGSVYVDRARGRLRDLSTH